MTIFLIALAIIICKVLGGLFVLKFRDKLHLILGFSAGTVLGVALLDLLPESIEMTNGSYDLSIITGLVVAGFVAYLLVDRLFSLHQHDKCNNPLHNRKLSVVALMLHSAMDGFGIGLAFQVSDKIGWIVAIAVLAHTFSDGINTVGLVVKGKGSKKAVRNWLIAGVIAPVIGIVGAYFVSVSQAVLGLILAVFAGLFLYISTSDLIPESHHDHPTIWTTIATIIGVLLICLISLISG